MDLDAFRILERKRRGAALDEREIHAVAAGAADGSWGEAELGAFLMACAIHGLDGAETRALTLAMLESGERWQLRQEIPHLGDKHSTGGVGDKTSLVVGPLMAACDRPIVMLAGRGLGHTGGTADKLEAVPGLDLDLDRRRCLAILERTGLAIGVATRSIAPADRRLYPLRDRTATIDVLPLVIASILSKKLATGAAAMVFDVKTGNGAFFTDPERSRELARRLVETTAALGCRAAALVTDMSQPLGRWVGHTAEVAEAIEVLEGGGPEDLREICLALSAALGELTGEGLSRARLERALHSGEARRCFERWAEAQGARAAWLRRPKLPVAPQEVPLEAAVDGTLGRVDTRRLGELLAAAGGGRVRPDAPIDLEVALRLRRRLGDRVRAGEELARLYLRRRDAALEEAFRGCFEVAEAGESPPLIRERLAGGG